MDNDSAQHSTAQYRSEPDYTSLMSRRVRNILLVCNSYDAFTLEEDGRLEMQISEEYNQLNLSNPPVICRAESTVEALEILRTNSDFDLILTMYNVGQLDPFAFSQIVRRDHPEIAIVLLTNYSRALQEIISRHDTSTLDYLFYWHGSADLIIAIIKLLEDRMNAEHDIVEVGVQAILLVEDSVRYYSTYLPAIYKLILQQTANSHEALNERQQIMSKRARPKILMATNYTDAEALYHRYRNNLLGVISDVGFVVNKGDAPESERLDAGIELCRMIRLEEPTMPLLLQSSQKSVAADAARLGAGFLVKNSKTLLIELGEFIDNEFAFGDFRFKDTSTGEVVARAKDLHGLQLAVKEVSDSVLVATTQQNLLSKWMLSRGLFSLGEELKSMRLEDFESVADMRRFLDRRINDCRVAMGQGVVARFDEKNYDETIWFSRIGNGSLGGKARGLAFLNHILQKYRAYDKYKGVRITIPRTVVVTTEFFDEFIRDNGLKSVIGADLSDEEILSEFVSSRLPQRLVDSLRVYVASTSSPIAIRSSSKLEDSYYQPFAGVYSTYMIPHCDPNQMLRMLGRAIKSVYASVYYAASKAYILATSNVISEERMAIVLQEVCGSEDGDCFLPTFSGVARSINLYPIGDEKPEEGVVSVAMGLGKAVVDGAQVLHFSPAHPKKVLQTSTPELALRDTQNTVYALELQPEKFRTSIDDAVNIRHIPVDEIASYRASRYLCSTWDMASGRMADTPFADGRKVITFAHILKYDTFPLAAILREVLDVYRSEMHCEVEIEFAARLDVEKGENAVFNLLQIRPITKDVDRVRQDWSKIDVSDALVYSQSVLGKGIVEGITDVVYVKTDHFDPSTTAQIAQEVAAINSRMKAEERGYVLIGPGRWGSRDKWLGVPVEWAQISEARVLVECQLPNFRIEASQGTHFFQNMTALGVGSMSVDSFSKSEHYHESVLNQMEAVEESSLVRHVRTDRPLEIFIDSLSGKGVIKL
ncbi:MAG: PEP/pyruvate-binding domain-containing protein [Tidjanibacter sp.]|nr:PEP/pyruvate-binding domain-containing protein [Tidjanibacter sp.]